MGTIRKLSVLSVSSVVSSSTLTYHFLHFNPEQRPSIRMKKTLTLSLGLLLVAGTGLAQAADPQRGKTLHDKHCISCHSGMVGGDGTLLYTRKNRRVKSFDELIAQINRCDQSLGLQWFPDDVQDVAAYLNQAFYKFPTGK